jgi:hypothetical protein
MVSYFLHTQLKSWRLIIKNILYRFFKDNGSPSGKNKRLLNEKFKQHFLGQELLCAEYAALERKQEEDLFSRVQLGVPLTPAEKLRASSGAWQAFALEIEQKYPDLMQSAHYLPPPPH